MCLFHVFSLRGGKFAQHRNGTRNRKGVDIENIAVSLVFCSDEKTGQENA